MKTRAMVALGSVCLLVLSGQDCADEVKVKGLTGQEREGDVLPELTFGESYQFGTIRLHANDRYGPEVPLLGQTYQSVDDGGMVRFTGLVIPSTGRYAFTANVDGKRKGIGYSEPFFVGTRNFAEVTCQEDGSIIGAASRQDPTPTIIGEGACKLTKGGGDPRAVNFGTLRCDFAGVSASCTAPNGNCFDRGPMVRIPVGTSVSASWGGGDVPEGSASATRPGAIDAGQPPSTQSRGAPLRMSFQGTDGGTGTVRLTVMQMTNSTVTIDCTAPEAAGVVEVPASLLRNLQDGPANVILRIDGRTRMPSLDFDTTLVVPGPTVAGYLTAVPITLTP